VSQCPIGHAAGLARLWRDHIGAIDSALTGGEEALPFDALGVMNLTLLALGITAGRLALLGHRAPDLFSPSIDFGELGAILNSFHISPMY
jgi:hypothetical protein